MAHKLIFAFIISSVVLLGACANVQSEAKYPTGFDRSETGGDIYAKRQSIMGDNGFCIGGSDQRKYMSEGAPEVFAKARIPLTEAVRIAEARTKGKAFNAGINPDSNHAVYIVKILKNGKVIRVLVDAKTGSLLN